MKGMLVSLLSAGLMLCFLQAGPSKRLYRSSVDASTQVLYVTTNLAIIKRVTPNDQGKYQAFYSLVAAHYTEAPELASQTGDIIDNTLMMVVHRVGLSRDEKWLFFEPVQLERERFVAVDLKVAEKALVGESLEQLMSKIGLREINLVPIDCYFDINKSLP